MGQHRRRLRDRCHRCRLIVGDCVCEGMPSLQTETRVVLVMHAREEAQLSNTGRLAHFTLPNSRIVLRGRLNEQVDLSELTAPGTRTLVLFPGPGVQDLSPADRPAPGERLTLAIPDGGWSQAKRIVRREHPLGALPWRSLPPKRPSRYHLRRAPQADFLATYESIAEALGVVEPDGPRIRDTLMTFFDQWVAKNLSERRGHHAKGR